MERSKYERPDSLIGTTIKEDLGPNHGMLYLTINYSTGGDPGPVEVLAHIGKAGGCNAAFLEGITRLVSMSLQEGIPVSRISHALKGIICCPLPGGHKSPADALGTILEEGYDEQKAR